MRPNINYLIAGVFVALIFITIITVTAILPAMTFTPVPSEAAYKYEPGSPEAIGRMIYRREGCFYCHSQFSRYQDREMGEVVNAGDYVYETPHVLGSERTGPDLSNIGGKYPDAWHWTHHVNPRVVKPGSIMPSFSYLSDEEMTYLVAYLQTVGAKRKQPNWVTAPQEYRDRWDKVKEAVDINSSAAANAGRGIYMQNCAQCHGVEGRGNGPTSVSMQKKPANFTRPFYKSYDDATWFWRVAEGVPGTRMPRWYKSLSDESMAYVAAFVKTLPQDNEEAVTSYDDVDIPGALDENFWEIEAAKAHGHNNPLKDYAPSTFKAAGADDTATHGGAH